MVSSEDAQSLAGVQDGFERLWTPHRMVYIKGDRPTAEAGDGCPFCAAPGRSDVDGLIVHRGTLCYAVMNLFPYNPGHVLICPYRHVSLYVDLTEEETAEFTALTKSALGALTAASSPMGFNIGMNQGAIAGAGVAAHLHQHIVPRWGGDRRRRGRRPSPPAHRAPVGRRRELPAGHRPDQGAAGPAGGHPPPAGRALARLRGSGACLSSP